jgi:limonene-1,2-epoxide hydrolase
MKNWIASRRTLLGRGALFSAAALSLAGTKRAEAKGETETTLKVGETSKNAAIVLAFCKAGEDRQLEKQMSYIAADSTYRNMPDVPMFTGDKQIRALLKSYLDMSEKTEINVLRIAEAGDGVVLTERVDRFLTKGKWIDCPVMGAAVVKNGKIMEWRDYYDNLLIAAQMKGV